MGLNFERIAAMKAAAASAQSVVPASSIAKQEVSNQLAQFEALSTQAIAAPAKQAESAGTINYHQVSALIKDLDARIKTAHPQMPVLLQEVWNTLAKYPECVTLLAEDEMEVIVSGLEKQTSTDLAAITMKAATSGKKIKQNLNLASLGF